MEHTPTPRRHAGQLLRQHRELAGLTQEQLAEAAGVSVRTVSNLETTAAHIPRQDTLARLAEALHLSLEDMAALRALARPSTVPAVPVARSGTSIPGAERLSASSPIPIPPTPLVGREREVEAATQLLLGGTVRLLTLVGLGGVGKTRLALEIARALREHVADGVVFVNLAPLHDPRLVLPAIAQSLGLREAGPQRLEDTICAYLSARQQLLVLDNFEHVAGAAAIIGELLAGCDQLTLLVTSRAALHLRGEHQLPVAPLALPALSPLPPTEALTQVPAVALFLQRVQAILPAFTLCPANAAAVAAICHRLDGLPLALELAAARIKLLSAPALLDCLAGTFQLLTDGAADLPLRQQTLWNTLAWSYDLLPEGAQALFRRLAIMRGGCTLEAAEALCAGATSDVFQAIATLVDHHLIFRQEGSLLTAANRFRMLATVREFAEAQLRAHGEYELAARGHAAHFLALAEAMGPRVSGLEQAQALEQLDCEHDNLRAALGWTIEQQDTATALRLAAALWRFWHARGYLHEGRRWLEAVLALPCSEGGNGKADDNEALLLHTRAEVLTAAGTFAAKQGEFAQALTLHTESLVVSRHLGDQRSSAETLRALAAVALRQRDFERAATYAEEALQACRQIGYARGEAAALTNLGIVAAECGEYARAWALCTESLALRRQLGNLQGIALSLHNLAVLAHAQDDLDQASALCEESVALYRQLEDRRGVAVTLETCARIALARGEVERAVTDLHPSLEACWGMGLLESVAACLDDCAGVACACERYEVAARLLGAASALYAALGTSRTRHEREQQEAWGARARAVLGGTAFQEASTAGAQLPLERVVNEALHCAGRDAMRASYRHTKRALRTV